MAQLRALTGLRFVAAASVVAFHFVRWRFDSRSFLRQIMACGFTAVGLFFVLSGFVLSYAHGDLRADDRDARRKFWRARFARIYPLYACAMIFGAVVTFWLGWTRPKDFASLVGALRIGAVMLMLPGVSHRTMFLFNWSAWSLTTELLFYFLFPFLVEPLKALTTRRLMVLPSSATILTMTVAAIYLAIDPDHLGRSLRLGDETVVLGHYLKFFPVMHLHEFLWGMTSGILWKRFEPYFNAISSHARRLMLVALILGGAAIAMLSVDEFYLYLHSGLLAPLFGAFVALLASETGVLTSPPMTVLGESSYAIYMLHVPLYLLMDKMLEHLLDANARCCIYLVVLVVVSIVTHYAWERPLREMIRNELPDDVDANRVGASAHAERCAENDDDAFAG